MSDPGAGAPESHFFLGDLMFTTKKKRGNAKVGKGAAKSKATCGAGAEPSCADEEVSSSDSRSDMDERADSSSDKDEGVTSRKEQVASTQHQREKRFEVKLYGAKETSRLTKMPTPSNLAVSAGKLLGTLNYRTGASSNGGSDGHRPPPRDFASIEHAVRSILPTEISDRKSQNEDWPQGELEIKTKKLPLCMKVGWTPKKDLKELDDVTFDQSGEEFWNQVFQQWDPDAEQYFGRGQYEAGDRVEVFCDEGDEGDEDSEGADWWSAVVRDVADDGERVQIEYEVEDGDYDEGEWVEKARIRRPGDIEVYKCSVFLKLTT